MSALFQVASKYAILGAVTRFVELMTFLEAPVFVVDPAVLRHLLVLNGNPNSRCKFFCQTPDRIVTFGTAANFWPDTFRNSRANTTTRTTAPRKVLSLLFGRPLPETASQTPSEFKA